MLNLTILYLVGLLSAFALYVAWLKSRLPIHVFQLLYRLGWRRNRPDFWPDPETVHFWLRSEWEPWVQTHLQSPWWAPLGEMLTCPYCVNYHISLWVAIALAVISGEPWLAALGALSWPGALLLLNRYV